MKAYEKLTFAYFVVTVVENGEIYQNKQYKSREYKAIATFATPETRIRSLIFRVKHNEWESS